MRNWIAGLSRKMLSLRLVSTCESIRVFEMSEKPSLTFGSPTFVCYDGKVEGPIEPSMYDTQWVNLSVEPLSPPHEIVLSELGDAVVQTENASAWCYCI